MRAAWVGEIFLVDEQSLIPRPLMAFADGTSSITVPSPRRFTASTTL
jgi:hypothetical protein